MDKQKFQIPMPDDQTIQKQIQHIVDLGLQQRVSFWAYLKQMYRQLGFKHLFSDRSELAFALATAMVFFGFHIWVAASDHVQEQGLYGVIFMSSPVLFLLFSIYTYANKVMNNTIEVEMTCKYNVYQIIGFRMLVYSVIAILFNTFFIFSLSVVYEELQFFRAFMISNTGLFTFSILLLLAKTKQRSALVAACTTAGWTLVNLCFMVLDHPIYHAVLVKMPLMVYAIVLAAAMYLYVKSLKELFIYPSAKGVY